MGRTASSEGSAFGSTKETSYAVQLNRVAGTDVVPFKQ
jgi:hypothetical protein